MYGIITFSNNVCVQWNCLHYCYMYVYMVHKYMSEREMAIYIYIEQGGGWVRCFNLIYASVLRQIHGYY